MKISQEKRIPKTLYWQTYYLIKDYYRLKDEADSLLDSITINLNGMPKSSGVSKITENKVLQREKTLEKINAIEKAINTIPTKLKIEILENIINKKKFDTSIARRDVFTKYKTYFIYEVAKNMCWI